jgi:hypothetical protein
VDLTTNAPGNGEVTWWKMGEKMLTYIYIHINLFFVGYLGYINIAIHVCLNIEIRHCGWWNSSFSWLIFDFKWGCTWKWHDVTMKIRENTWKYWGSPTKMMI